MSQRRLPENKLNKMQGENKYLRERIEAEAAVVVLLPLFLH